MNKLNVAILGCGTVGGGVAKILLELRNQFLEKEDCEINLVKIVDLFPENSSKRHNIPLNLFMGNKSSISIDEANKYIDEIINDKNIDLVVETIGGSNENILNIVLKILNSKKHLVTANKSLLAKYGNIIFETAYKNNKSVGFEASVCGAIPIIKTIKESFTGDQIISISGIMNGTSNYILSKMNLEGLSFSESLKLAQENGYAEADPTLDINGHDAGHKLTILINLCFGLNINFDSLQVKGIQDITEEDLDFAKEMESTIKLICYAQKEDNKVYATIQPMMVKNTNFLSQINGSTNGVRVINKYSQEHILIGKGAGSLETGSAIVSDIIFIAKYNDKIINKLPKSNLQLTNEYEVEFPYNIIFETEDVPGITGLITTAIGNSNINIDTVGHNRHNKKLAIFSISTMPCKMSQIIRAIEEIKLKKPEILKKEPKIFPILY